MNCWAAQLVYASNVYFRITSKDVSTNKNIIWLKVYSSTIDYKFLWMKNTVMVILHTTDNFLDFKRYSNKLSTQTKI